VKGLDLCRSYFRDAGWPTLEGCFPDYLDRIACGLIGQGSDVFGFDDEISRDHNWGPRFWVILSASDYASVGGRMQEVLLAELPSNFRGHVIRQFPPGRGERHVRVRDIGELCRSFLGYGEIPASDVAWLGIAEHRLFELQAGEVWHDPGRLVAAIRETTAYFPEMVWRKRMAFAWEGLFFADNFVRSALRGDRIAEHMYLGWALHCILRLAFMLNRRYAPYRKWLHRSFRELPLLANDLDPLLTNMMDGISPQVKREAFRACLEVLGRATNGLGLIESQSFDEETAYAASGAGFNCFGFAAAIQQTVTGPLARLSHWDGAPDQWAFDLGSAKPSGYPEIVRALFPEAWGEAERAPQG